MVTSAGQAWPWEITPKELHGVHLGGSVVKCLLWVQVRISGSWDRAPHQPPCLVECLLLLLPCLLLVFPLSLCVFFCQIHKQKLKEENSEIIHSCLGQSVSSCGKQVPAVSVAGISGALLVPQNLTLENVSKLDIAYDLWFGGPV